MASFPDRVVAIVCAALLEGGLDKALKRRLNDDPKGALVDKLLSDSRGVGTLGMKNQLAFALGVYSHQVMRDVQQVKQIRNVFAHELAIDRFDMSPVREHCQNLGLVDEYVFDSGLDESSIKWVKGLTQQVEDRDRIMAIPRCDFRPPWR